MILVTGASGYVGGRLVPRLLEAGHQVRVLARDPGRLQGRSWSDQVEVVQGDALKPDTLGPAMAGVTCAYYMIHSMQKASAGASDFHERDQSAARNFSRAAQAAGVKRIIYLGGLGDPKADLSHHLRSRQQTGDALREGGVPVTEFRAAVIVGSGSASFEMIRNLTERLPAMICPKWVYTRVQPIGIRNVLDYLAGALDVPESTGRTIEIGGADVLTYGDMMLGYARVRGLKRWLIPVPVLTPRLSSYWVHWVTPIPAEIAAPLIEGLRNEVVVRDDTARRLFPAIEVLDYRTAVERALAQLDAGHVESTWSDALVTSQGDAAPFAFTQQDGMLIERRQRVVTAPPAAVFKAFTGIGGDRGWPSFNWAWRLRGMQDRLIGGVGFRRGRRDPDELRAGDALDFWRVEAVEPDRLLRLRAEMKVPGRAWLQFEARPHDGGQTLLVQTAFFAPKGLLGLLYWYSLYPVHGPIFNSMIDNLKRKALHVTTRFLGSVFVGVLSTLTVSGSTPDVSVLENQRLRATVTDGRLESLVDLTTGETVRFQGDHFTVTINGQTIDSSTVAPALVSSPGGTAAFSYALPGARVIVTYELRPGWGFLSKRLTIAPTAPGTFRVNDVSAFDATVTPTSVEQLPLSEGRFGMVYRMPAAAPQSRGSSLFALYQNPYNVHTATASRLKASYAPEMDWNPANGLFETDRLLLGLVTRTGRVMPAKSVPEWVHVADYERYLRENPVIDDAESDALVDAVRAFLLYRPAKSIRVHVPWTENDYQIDVATPEGWAEYQRILDMAGQLGAGSTLFAPSNSALAALKDNRDAWGWENLLFFGLGQKIRKGEWVPGRDPVPVSLRTMLDTGAANGLKFVAYAYPTLPFLQDPAWTAWAKGELGGYRGVDTGQRGFQDWWVNTLVEFVKATGAGGFSFDHWWIAYDDPAATSKYTQWFGTRRILEELRRRVPDIVIDGRQQYMSFGPWTWLAGSYPHPTLTDEQPESFLAFPDLHTDRVSANRQRFAAWKYRVERFTPAEIMPGYITHQTERTDDKNVMRRDRFRPRDWDVLGWKYSLLSSVGTAPFNHTISYIPARDEAEFKAFSAADKAFFRRWLDWTDTNADVLRHLKPIIGPPMLGRVDGTAAISGNRGFVFVFNPNYRTMDGSFTLDTSIGLAAGAVGSRYVIKELHPHEGRLIGKPGSGVWGYGDVVKVAMPATEAVVLEITQATTTVPQLFNATGRVVSGSGTVAVVGVNGEPGTSVTLQVAVLPGVAVSGLTVNGSRTSFTRIKDVIEATVSFAGRAFGRGASVFPYDAAFTGGTLNGSVVIPSRVFTQLAARKAAWPVPYTVDDLRAPWLGSDRLLLFVQIAEPDEAMKVALTIDGKPVELIPAYNSIYGHAPKRTFLGFYADVSSLAPDVEHRIELRVPMLPPGRFQGLFFENVEPELTTVVRR